MRTTVRLPDDLIRDVKRLALETGRTLNQVIEDALREVLARGSRTLAEGPVRLPTFGRGGLRPGVDLDHSAALLDVLERPDDPPPR